MSQDARPTLKGIPRIGVLEASRWWTSAIRRNFSSWQIKVLEFKSTVEIQEKDWGEIDVWIVDFQFTEELAVQILNEFAERKLWRDSLFILQESRAHLQWKLRELGCSQVVISPHQEEELISWIKTQVRIPEYRGLPAQ